jgi:hypothetical protein
MIKEAIRFLTDEINDYMSAKLNISPTDPRLVTGNIHKAFDTDSGGGTESLNNKAIVSLINIEEDRLPKRQLPYVIEDDRVVYKNPAVHLNLYLMFAVNMTNYLDALEVLRYIVQFFQQQNVFTREQYPALTSEKLIAELYTLSFEQEKNLWGNLGGKSLPSALYKIRMVPIEEDLPYATGEYITEIGLDFPAEGGQDVKKITPDLNLRVLLQGAWRAALTEMGQELRSASLLPATDPYLGTTTCPGINTVGNVIDWVRIDLSTSTSKANSVKTYAGVVLKDGTIIDPNTKKALQITITGNYYVIISHRNHLAIATSIQLSFTGAPVNYDFTTSQSQAYQNPAITSNAAMAQVAPGRYGMWAGNANGNNTIRATGSPAVNDYSAIVTANSSNSYHNADINMDGHVNTSGAGNDYAFLLSVLNDAIVITQHS